MRRLLAFIGNLPAVVLAVTGVLFLAGALFCIAVGGYSAYETHALIASGKTPGAMELANAATVDKDLLCAFLLPTLTDPKAHLTAGERAAVIRDCPVNKENAHGRHP